VRSVTDETDLRRGLTLKFEHYQTGPFFDEMFAAGGEPRPAARALVHLIETMKDGELLHRQQAAERALLNMGITFNVYGDSAGPERIFPFDLVPRIVAAAEWNWIEQGLKQRIRALNLFIDDIYHAQKIVKDGVIPAEIIRTASSFRKECIDITPPGGVWCHITGTDLVRDRDGQVYVLEDNLRCPSGASYVLENRVVMKRTFPRVFESSRIRAVDDYPGRLRDMLESMSPAGVESPRVVVLTPGIHNSAYFEHSFLAQQMGVELVEGRDLVVSDGYVWMGTTKGFERVDVIYRRIDDVFLDPTTFRLDSALGVPGLMDVYRAGCVALANAPGTGVADDKVVYAYVPQMVKYYLGEEIIIPNVPTFVCAREADRKHVLAHLSELVVKAANESGGYGMLVGPCSTRDEQAEFARRIDADPRNYIAQPTLSLSRVPTIVDGAFQGRHVDLRPYILYGKDIYVLPGGLTRVALKEGSLVVNSSQGGGSKDTWVIADDPRGVIAGGQS
jgi:uncharacterized circularly permuted ATP-grasp superfamily protein